MGASVYLTEEKKIFISFEKKEETVSEMTKSDKVG